MKAWYDDIDSATLHRIKTYSAFNDAKSKNLMVQTMYEYREKEIQDFKETNHELAETCIERKKRIAELEKENTELKENNKSYEKIIDNSSTALMKEKLKNYKQLTKAKEIIKKFLLWENDWHNKTESKYELLNEAEQFLKEVSE